MQSCYSKGLEIILLEILPPHQSFIDYTHSNIQCFWPQLELIVQLSEPVHQVLAVLIRNLTLEASVQEISGIHMPELFFPHVGYDFWDEFDH